jgi:hypothetical protein
LARAAPSQHLLEGAQILSPVLDPHGFAFRLGTTDLGSGGPIATAVYLRHDRHIELLFRSALLGVSYHHANLAISHTSYMLALGASLGAIRLSSFGSDPMDGFRALADDLQQFASEFLQGIPAVLLAAAPQAAATAHDQSARRMAEYAGDRGLVDAARAHFRAGEYTATVDCLSRVQYPGLLAPADVRMLSIAQNRSNRE